MLLKNLGIEQAVRPVTIAEPSPRSPVWGEGRELAVEAGEKKAPKRPNEANILHGINNLTQKTNPNEATKSFVLGGTPKTNPNEATKPFRFGVPWKTNPRGGTRQLTGG
jgi:hypothetical protein